MGQILDIFRIEFPQSHRPEEAISDSDDNCEPGFITFNHTSFSSHSSHIKWSSESAILDCLSSRSQFSKVASERSARTHDGTKQIKTFWHLG